ncbi:MAG TPA: hypothetical protein DDY78_29205 [Planctomycetales bacterium]|jgi:excisionase family DNA binding protein|nr:hypothetical protein [Planctomycetales bacterium]
MTRPLMTTKDICNLYKITRFTVPKWVRANLLPAPIRMGRALRWDADQVEAALRIAAESN